MHIIIVLTATMLSVISASSSLQRGMPYFNLEYTIVDENGDEELRKRQMLFDLDWENTPIAAYNFYKFAEGDEKLGNLSLHYENSIFHRIIPGFMMQGGDILNNDGTGSVSIYSGQPFEDEKSKIMHNKAGILSMANRGPNTNGSQFFITFGPQRHLDGKHTAFGRLIGQDGIDVLREIEQLVSINRHTNRPRHDVRIVNSGIKPLPKGEGVTIKPDELKSKEPAEL
ncbi:cyclophilin type peptidyl-prolylcis-transisomerase/CLD [Ordospora pajunii]|uniref:cyclophilin type peptidyl-prolylcis-transisomerase/CLD n=1 Tax=Ordospora pajunii TaxID=3039483 RepID=UPI00295279EB|nr:cyclophilin type peptidyl-prolylcis-transisomerase/CLD [Ordospora pajunii]KAH9411370.1 cyclophilin type peptidyl-prolylcis-transisomerase/CLD [Ordospora pajunii]